MSETDRDFVSRMHDKHLRCEAMSFDDGNRVFALALSGAEAAALTTRVKELEAMLRTASDMNEVYEGRFQEMEAALGLYREAVRIDATMEGPKFMGANASALKRAWDADRAALTQPATEKGEEWNHKEEQQMWDIAAEVSRDGE